MSRTLKVAINGVGIAGPTLAYWLHRFGHEPVLIEKAPELRSGGYVIDFWGLGYDIAERMGLMPRVRDVGYDVQDVRWVDAEGKTTGSFSPDVFRRMTEGRYVSVERSGLAAILYHAVEPQGETIFGDSIAGIEDGEDGVRVTFEHAPPREFDLVVGTDGLHSRVRELAFGPMDTFERDLGLRVAAFELDGYRPRDELVFVSHAEPGRQVSRMSKRDDRTLVFFAYRSDLAPGGVPRTQDERKAELEAVFRGLGWECPAMLAALPDVDDLYFDRVSQIHMARWTAGRVALVGDAAAAVSLLAGEGTGLAMTEAYVLAGELARAGGDHTPAFARYEERLRPFLKQKQDSALTAASSIVPKTRLGIACRDVVTRLLHIPFVARWALGALADDVDLPTYGGGPSSPIPPTTP